MNLGEYARKIELVHAELGIPRNYALSRRIGLRPETAELEVIAQDDTGPIRLAPITAEAWRNMAEAAKAEHTTLLPVSGFRSVQRQTELIRAKLKQGQTLDDILQLIAAPGYSEHHTGRAIDLGAPDEPPLEEGFERTSAFRWLAVNGRKFGFSMSYPRDGKQGFKYEPWHWFQRF